MSLVRSQLLQNLSVRFTKLGADSPDRVTFQHLQRLSEYSDLLIRLFHALQLNLVVLEMLSAEATRRQAEEGKDLTQRYNNFQAALRACITEHTFLRHHVSLVRDSAERLAIVVSRHPLSYSLERIQESQPGLRI
jgi:hypothetical protein